jgi:uncharacterized protein (TIGR02646 family)
MIRIIPATEPTTFDVRVRIPGRAFLATLPTPRSREWNGHDYWKRCMTDLRRSYSSTCAYCASWTLRRDCSVDHFVPKSATPMLAYEWNNFRLSRKRLNHRKSNHRDVLDPFTVSNDWFELDFRTFLIHARNGLPEPTASNVRTTISRLQLNADNDYVFERMNIVRQYCLQRVSLAQVAQRYPFVALEMTRQNFEQVFRPGLTAMFQRLP